ncbi:MAG: hypothetical protein AB7G37_14760 [Solirubrobacteraceae bacterium]
MSNTGPEHRIADGRLVLTLDEYRIDPRNLTAPAGPLRIEVRNAGRLLHSVRVISDDDKRGGRRETFATSMQPPVQPGERRAMTFRIQLDGETRTVGSVCLHPGDYRIISGEPGDEELGMVADLRVDGAAPSCRRPDARRARARPEPDEN